MHEEQNQSVRYSQLISHLSNELSESSSTQFLMTWKNDVDTSKWKRMLFGFGTFVMIFASIVSIVAIVSSQKSSMKTVMRQNNFTISNASSFATSKSFFSHSKGQLIYPLKSKKHRTAKPLKNDDWMSRRNFSRTTPKSYWDQYPYPTRIYDPTVYFPTPPWPKRRRVPIRRTTIVTTTTTATTTLPPSK